MTQLLDDIQGSGIYPGATNNYCCICSVYTGRVEVMTMYPVFNINTGEQEPDRG
jgi:hypothetical protein